MKKMFFIYFICTLLTIATSCSKDKQALINTTWRIESLKVHADSTWIYPETTDPIERYALTFKRGNQYGFCASSGKVKFMANQKIKFECKSIDYIGCPYYVECHETLHKSTHYELLENIFILKGEDGCILNFFKIE